MIDTLHQYATFVTFPNNPHQHNILLTHNSQADRTLPNESNLWTQVEHHVTKRSQFECSNIHGTYSNVEQEDGERDVVHLIGHIGNFLSVDQLLRSSTIQLMNDICNDDITMNIWKQRIVHIEDKVRQYYRTTLSENRSISRTLRSCGNVFLCGSTEAGGSGLHDLFATYFASTMKSSRSFIKKNEQQDVDQQDVVVVVDEQKDVDDQDVDDNEDKIWKSVGEQANADREHMYNYTLRLSRDQQQVAKLIYGMLLRVARYSYVVVIQLFTYS